MNRQVVTALFWDALYQVLDNRVFRILASLVVLFVALTFVIGAREDSLVLLFGWKEIRYEEIFRFFDMPYRGQEGAGEILIQSVQSLLVDGLAGTLGIMFAVAATAFFVPRMLEKGAADTLFSKPVGRVTLLLSRYTAGLIFVALLATTLVGGMHLGFLLNSGYSDPGVLWSIVTLVYVFGLLHGVSILVGVLTRSTVAAILITLMFSVLTGCVHNGWRMKEMFVSDAASGRFLDDAALEARAEASEALAAGDEGDGDLPAVIEEEEDEFWQDLLLGTLDVVHYVLPKTSDASVIAKKMRDDWERRYVELWDEAGGLLVAAAPEGWTRTGEAGELDGQGVVWSPPEGTGSVRLSRRPLAGTNRIQAARDLKKELGKRDGVGEIESDRGNVANTASSKVIWNETADGVTRRHRRNYFMGGSQLYALEIEGEPEWYADEATEDVVQEFARGITFNAGENATDPFQRFQRRLAWDAPWPYNIWFSILSSLAFLAVVMGFAAWRLARIDF